MQHRLQRLRRSCADSAHSGVRADRPYRRRWLSRVRSRARRAGRRAGHAGVRHGREPVRRRPPPRGRPRRAAGRRRPRAVRRAGRRRRAGGHERRAWSPCCAARWRVTVMPLATIARSSRRDGPRRRRGSARSARSSAHAGLHLGVRRDGVRFGYVDPLRFLAPRGVRAVRRAASRRRAPLPRARRRVVRAHAPARAPAPWPAWVGLALVLLGVGVRGVSACAPWRRRTSTAAGWGGCARVGFVAIAAGRAVGATKPSVAWVSSHVC